MVSQLNEKLKKRRSCRKFSQEPIDIKLIYEAIEAAKHAPSGANKQPWTFCVIKNQDLKKQIRLEAEKTEKEFYDLPNHQWHEDLKVLKTTADKRFLEEAPYLIVLFKHTYQFDVDGNKTNVYYPDISIGIATGMLLSVLVDFDIDTLTYTPSSNLFLSNVLKRPKNEKPYLIIACGKRHSAETLPNITKKSLHKVMKIY